MIRHPADKPDVLKQLNQRISQAFLQHFIFIA